MDLTGRIKSAVQDGHYVVGVHARQRLAERNVRLWQVAAGLVEGRVTEVRAESKPTH